jgi:3-oxoacyl-[acyl-carrier protein] reductase
MVNMSRLSNKVAIVTGASKGIGGGIATALGAAGARVAVNFSGRFSPRVAQAITDNGGEAIAVGADVSKAADVARLFKEVHSAFGRLDVLVNNAGVFRFGAFAEIPTAGASSTSALSSARIRWREPCCTLPRKAPSKR